VRKNQQRKAMLVDRHMMFFVVEGDAVAQTAGVEPEVLIATTEMLVGRTMGTAKAVQKVGA